MKKLIFVLALGLVLGMANSASAALTTILPNTAGEPSLITPGGILDNLYGLSNLLRIDDLADQLWYVTAPDAYVQAVSKNAGYSQYLYAGAQFLFAVPPSSIPSGNIPVTTGGNFSFRDDPNGAASPSALSSVPTDNTGDNNADHMVTWQVLNDVYKNAIRVAYAGDYIMAWEDSRVTRPNRGDRDYNDIVYRLHNVAPVPEPASMALLGLGVLGLFGLKRKKA